MEFNNLDEALVEFGERVVDEMRDQLFENNSVGTGDLARSLQSNIISDQQGEKLRVSLLWYGELLEDGGPQRRAGRIPPVQPIIGWIKRKKIPVPAKFKSPKSFAFAIARSIGKKGVIRYPKKPFIMESINNAATNFGNKAIQDAISNDIIFDINSSIEKNSNATIT